MLKWWWRHKMKKARLPLKSLQAGKKISGLFRWRSSKESSYQCRRHKRHRFDPWVAKIFWSSKWQCSSILAWKIPWTEEPGRLQSTGSRRVRHGWAHTPKKRSRKQASVITSLEKILEASIIFSLPHPPPGGTSLSCLVTWLILGTVD